MKNKSLQCTFLGTGTSQGIPIIGSTHPVCLSSNPKDTRLRSSVFIEVGDVNLLIDCGPDFRQQALTHHISYLEAILCTHEHNDHVLGLDDTRPIIFNRQSDLPLYGLQRTLEEIKVRFPYAFTQEKYPGVPSFELHEIDADTPFEIQGIGIIPIQIQHGKLPILGYRIGDFAYITDASKISESEMKKLANLKVLVINALRKEPDHFAHFTLSQALEVVAEINPETAYFTHISHLLGFHDEVEKELPNHIHLAYDGLKV